MKQMTITEALRELSLYDEKITKAIIGKAFVGLIKKNADEKDKKSAKKEITSNYDSIKKIIDNRDKIKSAVIQSNATTEVTVNGVAMTVAEAIDKKHSIEQKERLLAKLAGQFDDCKRQLKLIDEDIDSEVEDMLKKIAGSDATDVAEKRKVLETAYRESHAYEIVDPISIEKEIDKLRDEIDGFKKEVDVALSLSNAVTLIEVDI